MDVQDVEQSVLHLAYIMSTTPDTSRKDTSEVDAFNKKWANDATRQHDKFYNDVARILDKSCTEFKAAFITAILENDLEENKTVRKLWPKLNRQRGIDFVTKDPETLILLLGKITERMPEEKELFFEYLLDCITKYSQQVRQNTGENELILNKTILISKLYLLIHYSIDLLRSIDDGDIDGGFDSRISGPLWVPGGIENYKQKRKNLVEKLKGERQEYVPDKHLWELALEKVLYSKMVSFRGLGGYGKTTLARELVIHLIAEKTQRFFDEYHLISFKDEKQGDFDPSVGGKVDPTHNMDIEQSTYDDVINNLFVKLSKKIDSHSQDSSIEYKEQIVIDKITSNSCLIVLDNFEDIEADKSKKVDLEMFISFFRRVKKALREKGQTTSCILITSRTDPDREANEIFESVDLGGDHAIQLSTSKRILISYLNFKKTHDRSISNEKLTRALQNIDARMYTCNECGAQFESQLDGEQHIQQFHETTGFGRMPGSGGAASSSYPVQTAKLNESLPNWQDLTTRGPGENIPPERSNDILRYPIVINFIASEMLRQNKKPKQIVLDFILDLNSDRGMKENLVGTKLVDYVVSKSYDTRLSDEEKQLTRRLLNEYSKNNILELGKIINILQDEKFDLLAKLIDLKFLEPLGSNHDEYAPTQYTFPPLIAGYIRRNSTLEQEDIVEDKTDELKLRARLLRDSKSDDYEFLIETLNLFIESDSLPLLSELGAANLLQNTNENILHEPSEIRQQWLRLNEYIESNINYDVGTNKDTRSTACKIINQDFDNLTLTDYPTTMFSLLEQIDFEIKDESTIKIIETYYLRKQSKTFPCENIVSGDIIAFGTHVKPELMYESNVTVFRIKSGDDEVIFSINKSDVDVNDVIAGQIIVLGKNGPAYRIRTIDAPIQDLKQELENPAKIVDLILENGIITSRYEAGFIALPNVNRLLRKDISLDDLKMALESDSRFIIDSERPFWLAKRKPESRDWKPVAEACGLPTDLISYLYVIKMMQVNIESNDSILRFEFESNFVNPCVTFIKSEGVTDINTTKLKRILDFMKEHSTKDKVLTYNSAKNVRGFINEAKSRLKLRIRRELGKAKNTRVLQPYIDDLFDEINLNSTNLNKKMASNIKDYKSNLLKEKQIVTESQNQKSAPDNDKSDSDFVAKHDEVIRPFIQSLPKADQNLWPSTIGNLKKLIMQKLVESYPHVSKSAFKNRIISKASLGSNSNLIKNKSDFKRCLTRILDMNEFWQLITDNMIIISLDSKSTAKLFDKYLD